MHYATMGNDMATHELAPNIPNTVQDNMFENNSCFVAGTLRRTEQGM